MSSTHSAAGGPIVRRVLDLVRRARENVGPDQLIHADLHQENYLFTVGDPAGIGAIDFDDCGYGPAVYDLAVTFSELQHRPDYRPLRAATLAGYREVLELPRLQEEQIDAYIAFRFLQLMFGRIEERTSPLFRDSWFDDVTGNLGLLERLTRRVE